MKDLLFKPEGVLLVGTGPKHQAESIAAAHRIRPHLGGRPIWLLCDNPGSVPAGCFDRVLAHPDPRMTYRDKIVGLLRLPFRRTLFLDSDVELLEPIDDMFSLLRQVDLVGCHAPIRWFKWIDPKVPEGLVELNSGVLGLRRSWRQRRLVRRWLETYDRVGVNVDQASLRSALWWSIQRGLRCWILPPEYNLRTTKPWIAGPDMKVKIVHGRIPEKMRAPLADYLNSDPTRFRASSAFSTHQNTAVAPWPALAPKRIFVVGAGRSGTSLLAGLFRKSGLFMGDAHYLPREANPTGFFEDREVNDINESLLASSTGSKLGQGQRWLASLPVTVDLKTSPEARRRMLTVLARGPLCFKDPRFCFTLDRWIRELPVSEQSEAQCICVFRHPSIVVSSVLKELQTAPYLKDLNLSSAEILTIWEAQYRYVLQRQRKLGRWLFIHYDELFTVEGLARLQEFTGIQPDKSIVQENLRRSKPDVEASDSCLEIYAKLKELAREGS